MNRKDQQNPNQSQDRLKDKSRDKSGPAQKQDSGTFRKDKDDLNKDKQIKKDKY
jgi:hypothetical protein